MAALILFVAASFSDLADGFIARRWGLTSRSGAWLDPIADKLLMLLCFLALWKTESVPLWLVVLVIARDAGIMGGALLAKLFGCRCGLRRWRSAKPPPPCWRSLSGRAYSCSPLT